jgi:hypothetical protein
MKIMKIRALANLNLWPEMWRREWHFISMKMGARFGPLELVLAIFGPNCQNPLFGPFEFGPKKHHQR